MPDFALDFEALRRRTLRDDALMREMLSLFRGEMTAGLPKLRAAVETGDMPAAARLAHRLKGSAVTICAAALGAVLSQIEAFAIVSDADFASTLLPQAEAAFAGCVTEIDAKDR